MKNYFLFIIKSKLKLKISGNNINRFIKRLESNNIEMLSIKTISKNEVILKIYKEDYEKLFNLKTIYNIEILDYFGLIRFKNNLLNNKFIILLILISLIVIYTLSNIIFSIDVITNDYKMEKILNKELEELGIKKYNFKKNYNELQNIKKEILNKYKDSIEWIEIESIGTKYIVKYEPRILNENIENTNFRHIVARKSAIINKIYIKDGQIIKGVNSYVKKGDIIVSGYIDLNGNIKDTVSSNGLIYGETWYNVTVTYPYKYYESYETGNEKDIFVIKLFNKEIEIFNFKKYKTKNKINTIILKNNLLPISFVKQKQRETKVINESYSENELIDKAVNFSINKLEKNLKDGEYVKNYKILNKIKNKDSITLNIFFTIVEDITDYQNIEEYNDTLE